VPDLGALARLAWRLGDRHIPVQILPKRLRVSRDPIAEAVLRRFGVVPVAIEAPFEPEGGAYRSRRRIPKAPPTTARASRS